MHETDIVWKVVVQNRDAINNKKQGAGSWLFEIWLGGAVLVAAAAAGS